jgi:hypothetical protein
VLRKNPLFFLEPSLPLLAIMHYIHYGIRLLFAFIAHPIHCIPTQHSANVLPRRKPPVPEIQVLLLPTHKQNIQNQLINKIHKTQFCCCFRNSGGSVPGARLQPPIPYRPRGNLRPTTRHCSAVLPRRRPTPLEGRCVLVVLCWLRGEGTLGWPGWRGVAEMAGGGCGSRSPRQRGAARGCAGRALSHLHNLTMQQHKYRTTQRLSSYPILVTIHQFGRLNTLRQPLSLASQRSCPPSASSPTQHHHHVRPITMLHPSGLLLLRCGRAGGACCRRTRRPRGAARLAGWRGGYQPARRGRRVFTVQTMWM